MLHDVRTSPRVKEPPRDGSPCSPARATPPPSSGSAGSCPTCAPPRPRPGRLGGEAGRAFVRFDYAGHGASGGRFEEARFRTGSRTHWPFSAKFAPGAARPGRLLHGRMDSPPGHAGAPENGARASTGRARPDRAGGRFHRKPDVGLVPGGHQRRPSTSRCLPPAIALFERPLPDHPRADRGRPRHLLFGSRSRPAAPSTSSRACRIPTCLGARSRTRRTPARRQRLHDAHQGWRPPPVAARRISGV